MDAAVSELPLPMSAADRATAASTALVDSLLAQGFSAEESFEILMVTAAVVHREAVVAPPLQRTMHFHRAARTAYIQANAASAQLTCEDDA